MNPTYDTILIGSGLGSLVCAASLARAGEKVLVLEQHTIPGGFATTFRRKKWQFEVSLHTLSDCAEGGKVYETLTELGILEQLNLGRAEVLYRSVYPKGEFTARADYRLMVEDMKRCYPEEAEGIEALIDVFIKLRSEMENMGGGVKMQSSLYWKYDSYTLQQLMDEYIRSPELQMNISALWGYYGLPPSEISAGYFASAWVEYHVFGGFYPSGQSQSISNALKEVIQSNGGTILMRHKVERIIVENGIVRGVDTGKRGLFLADCVISNADPIHTFGELVGYDQLPEDYAAKVKKLVPSCSLLQAYVIVDTDLRKEYGETAHEVMLHQTNDYTTLHEDLIQNRKDRVPLCITYFENIVPGYRDQGKSTLSVTVWARYEDWCDLTEEDYRNKKLVELDWMFEKMERLYPGFSKKIEYAELSTPMTVLRYTGNYRGAVYGAAQTVDQALHRRMSQITPVKGLYLVGAWTRPGHGYSSVISSGARLAKMLLRRKVRRRKLV